MKKNQIEDTNIPSHESYSKGPMDIITQTQLTPDDMFNGTVPNNNKSRLDFQLEQDTITLNPDIDSMQNRG